MPEYNAKRVIKIYKGDTQIWNDGALWTLLKLGSGVTGTVLFKDNGDGTGALAGSVLVQGFESKAILYPPDGYQFVSIDWDNGLITGGSQGVSNGANTQSSATINQGALYISGVNNYGASAYCKVFQRGTTREDSSVSNAADPAIIKIKSI